MGRLDAAIQAHRRAIAAGPGSPELRMNLSEALIAAGKEEEGRQVREQALRLQQKQRQTN